MKVDPFVQARLLTVAAADAELVRIAHKRKTLPEEAEVARLAASRQTSKDAAVAVEITIDDLDRDIKKLETDVEGVRKRIKRDEDLLASGALPAKQQTDVEHELQTLHRRQENLEEDLLEVMERRETAVAELGEQSAELARLEIDLAAARGAFENAVTELEKASLAKSAERESLIGNVPDELATAYERQRATYGLGAALLRARQCGACRIEIDRGDLAAITNAASDDVVTCPECGTILIRTDESGI
ncbi:MAG: C4-type zinc ribbon domain-containing protein [Nocardiaceae bacterium]|nr:C4-type zinc ribbon domain-containing protein [Nocardiaceae bacterium]